MAARHHADGHAVVRALVEAGADPYIRDRWMRTAADVPPLHNTRPVMAQNDTHAFGLLGLAPRRAGVG